jgi:hypothetical protein
MEEAEGMRLALAPFSEWWDELPRYHFPPGYFLILKFQSWFSFEDAWLRFPPALFGALSILVFFFLTREREERPAWVAALWLGVSPLLWSFSQEARTYTLWVFLELAVTWVLWRTWKDPSRRRLFLLGMLFPLPLLFHYNALWFAIGRFPLLLAVLGKSPHASRTGFALGIVPPFLLVLPFLLKQLEALPARMGGASVFWPQLDTASLTQKVGEMLSFPYPFDQLAWVLVLFAGVGLTARIVFHLPWGKNRSPKGFAELAWVIMVVFPLIAVVAGNLASGRYIATRHLLPILPFALWESSRGLRLVCLSLGPLLGKGLYRSLAIGLAVFWCWELGVENSPRNNPPWRDISYFLEERMAPGGNILLAGDNVSVLDYYRQTRGQTYRLRRTASFDPELLAEVDGILISGERDPVSDWWDYFRENRTVPEKEWTSRRIHRIAFFVPAPLP